MQWSLADVVDLTRFPLSDGAFRNACKSTLDLDGALALGHFLRPAALASILRDAERNRHLAYYTTSKHNIFLTPPDPHHAAGHPRNREVSSSKGCITADQIPEQSVLHVLHGAPEFRAFLCAVLDEDALHGYADPLSSLNINYASAGQELGWHFDNSSFAITLMIQQPERGGEFEYVKDVRDADRGEMNYELCGRVLDGEVPARSLAMDAGTLALFRGRNSMHRVKPVAGSRTRILGVLAYDTQPGISLSESARMTFYGRLE